MHSMSRCLEETTARHGVVIEVSSSLCRVSLDVANSLVRTARSLSAHDTALPTSSPWATGARLEDGSERGVVEAVLLARAHWPGPMCSIAIASSNRGQRRSVAHRRGVGASPVWLELMTATFIARNAIAFRPLSASTRLTWRKTSRPAATSLPLTKTWATLIGYSVRSRALA